MTAELMSKYRLTSPKGILIRKVEPGSRAFQDGLRAGMVIREFTYRMSGEHTAPVRVILSGLKKFEIVLQKIPPGSNVLARIGRGSIRGERTFFRVLRNIRPR